MNRSHKSIFRDSEKRFTQEVFTTSGSWLCPLGVTQVSVGCYGSGGGGAARSGSAGGAAGGGGGAYARKKFSVTPGNSYNFTVGTGGAGGNNAGDTVNDPGDDGTDTYWDDGSQLKAAAGKGAPSLNAGGAGGAIADSIGDIKFAGGNGGNGANGTDRRPGQGGGCAGSMGPGNNGANAALTDVVLVGIGHPQRGGNGGRKIGTSNGASNGVAPGGGGSGYRRDTGVSGFGGNGANGMIVITYITP